MVRSPWGVLTWQAFTGRGAHGAGIGKVSRTHFPIAGLMLESRMVGALHGGEKMTGGRR